MVDLADHTAWVSHGDAVGGDVFCYDTSGADYGAVAYGDAGKDDDSAANPAAAADFYGKGVGAAEIFTTFGIPVQSESVGEFHRVGGCVYLYI